MADALVSHFRQILATMAEDEAKLLLGAKRELNKLEEKVLSIHKVLEDAERKAFTDESIQTWLDGLKDAVYDADDIIDYSRTRAETLTRVPDGQVRCYSPIVVFFRKIQLRHEMGTRIKGINERIEGVVNGQSVFQLIATTAATATSDRGSGGGSSAGMMDRQTGPLLDPNIVGAGIENDTKLLVGVLLAVGFGIGRPMPPIAAIAGMAGVGKSTLAQMIYNHKSIKENFELRMWVCVSKNYINTNLLGEVIKCADSSANIGGAESISTLESMLADAVKEKKFLLVLDDVWGVQVWNDLLGKPLHTGAPGSRVLITTRDKDVALEMGAAHLHTVLPLPVEDSWALLCKMLFSSRGEELDLVKDIAFKILDKCGYLPLAIKTIAGVLRKKRTRPEWQSVLDNPAWLTTTGVMGVLYLSYHDLPFHLKQCFIYCSLFPEDHLFMRHTLLQLWVAAGFITEGERRGQVMEEVANGYYKELLTRSLLQPDLRYYSDGACTMHDLLRSLGHLLARKESFVGDAEGLANFNTTTTTTSTKLRHLCIVDPVLNSVPDDVKKHESLRTLLFKTAPLTNGIPHDLFEKLWRLRVLDFTHTDVICLPDSLGNLIHLRFLDVSHSSIAELPESIGKLSNLEYLILQRCKNLEKLPKGVANLYKLRSLDLLNTPVMGLPAGIGKLQQLNRLMGFVTNESKDGGWCRLEELKTLSKMRSLTIGNLERAVARDKPTGPLLMAMSRMRHLELYCTQRHTDEEPYSKEEAQNIFEVFEHELSPAVSVEKFEIKGFFGFNFPSWMMNRDKLGSLINLKRLDLLKCEHCDELPPLGQLRSLDLLTIKGASAVKTIRPEFMGGGSWNSFVSFPKLETLKLKGMDSLEEWQWEAEQGARTAMPLLQNLEISNCPKLMSLPGGLRHSTMLTALIIEGADNITEIANLVSLKALSISDNSNLVRISNLHNLEAMIIDGCSSLRDVEGLFSVQHLSLQDMSMKSLPDWLLLKGGEQPSFPELQRLEITAGRRLLRRCLMNGPDWPKIMHFSQVYIRAFFRPEFVMYTRDPFSFNTNVDAGGDSNSEDSEDGLGGISEEAMLALQKLVESLP